MDGSHTPRMDENPEIYKTHSTYQYEGRIIKILKDYTNGGNKFGNPFFMFLSMQLPHAPFSMPKKYHDMYEDITTKGYNVSNEGKTSHLKVSPIDK